MDRHKNKRTQFCIPVEAAGPYSIHLTNYGSETKYGLQFLKFVLGFLQAELAMRADGKPGMSNEEVSSLTAIHTAQPL